jgi:hypothetical protein
VRATKLHAAYRTIHADLRSVAPTDVWFDSDMQKWLVAYASGATERIYLFALSGDAPMPIVLSVHRITAHGNEWLSESMDR